MSCLKTTLRSNSEIAIFLSLESGDWVGGESFRGFNFGAVKATTPQLHEHAHEETSPARC
jgi:hypothetical protein